MRFFHLRMFFQKSKQTVRINQIRRGSLAAILFLGAIFLGCQHHKSATYPAQSYLRLEHLLQVSTQDFCFKSIFDSPLKSGTCTTWNRNLSVGLAVENEQIYFGGYDGIFRVFRLKNNILRPLKARLLGKNVEHTPILVQDRIFAGTQDGFVLALKKDNLETAWQTQLDSEITAPLLLKTNTIFAVTGLYSLYALNSSTGEILWKTTADNPKTIALQSMQSPLHIQFDAIGNKLDSFLALGHPNGYLQFYFSDSGKMAHKVLLGNDKQPFPDVISPILAQKKLIAAAHNNGIFALDPYSGAKLWHNSKALEVAQLATNNNLLVAASSNQVFAINLNNGAELWKRSLKQGSISNLLIKNGFIYCISENGPLYVLAFDGSIIQTIPFVYGFSKQIDYSDSNMMAITKTGHLAIFSTQEEGEQKWQAATIF